MKHAIYLALALMITIPAYSDDHGKEGMQKENLEKAKTEAIANIDQRISVLQGGKSCISSATSREDMKKCRKDVQAKMKEIQAEMKSKREKMKSMKGKRKSKDKE